jgi:hypothetical protein
MATFVQNSNRDDAGDVQLMFPGDRFPVIVGPNLRASGWRGGLFVAYATGTDDFTVEVSDGISQLLGGTGGCGFLLFQSEDYQLTPPTGAGPGSPQNFTSTQFLNPVGGNNVVTLINGGTRAFFSVFETVGRFAPIVGVPLTYTLNEPLYISENGLPCNQAGMAGTPPLLAGGLIEVGIVSAIPAAANGNRLCLDMKY